MELVIQTIVVAVLVLASAVYAAWRLMPGRSRLRLLEAVNPQPTHAAGRWLLRLRGRVITELAHGCSACSQPADKVKKHIAQH
ncbi:MAG: DUF6587 family protein [Gammaproteobacteria bacterium]